MTAPIATMAGQTVEGILYVWVEDRALYANVGRSLIRVGDTHMPVSQGALLAPWLLMSWMPVLQAAFPSLSDAHYALLMRTEALCTTEQNLLWSELLALAPSNGSDVPVMGLQLAQCLYQQAVGANPEFTYAGLQAMLAYLLYRDDVQVAESPQGPRIAVSPVEMAQLYHALVLPLSRDVLRQCPDELTEPLNCWDRVSGILRQYPAPLMPQAQPDASVLPLIAWTEGPQRLCMGIGPHPAFADGLGIYLSLADTTIESADDLLVILMGGVLRQLQLLDLASAFPAASSALQFHVQWPDSLLPGLDPV